MPDVGDMFLTFQAFDVWLMVLHPHPVRWLLHYLEWFLTTYFRFCAYCIALLKWEIRDEIRHFDHSYNELQLFKQTSYILQIGSKSVVNKIDIGRFFPMKFDSIQMSLTQVLPTKYDAVQIELERQRNNLTSKNC